MFRFILFFSHCLHVANIILFFVFCFLFKNSCYSLRIWTVNIQRHNDYNFINYLSLRKIYIHNFNNWFNSYKGIYSLKYVFKLIILNLLPFQRMWNISDNCIHLFLAELDTAIFFSGLKSLLASICSIVIVFLQRPPAVIYVP